MFTNKRLGLQVRQTITNHNTSLCALIVQVCKTYNHKPLRTSVFLCRFSEYQVTVADLQIFPTLRATVARQLLQTSYYLQRD